jgi:Protein of unknown function DUF262
MGEEVTVVQQVAQDLEGLDVAGGSGWGDYPLDAVFVRTETRTVAEVVKRIRAQRYVLDPEFQRDFVWPPAKQSKLIESAVMRIPLPVFYVAEAEDGRIIVVDGLQRLRTFERFLGGKLQLNGLTSGENGSASHELEKKYFNDLPLKLQERVQDTQLTMYILDAKAPERARLDIFERVNSGEPLTRQQMRNALYNGPATEWLKQAAQGEAFQKATGGSLSAKTMRDREVINRFCAFRLLGWKRYVSGEMDAFLAEGLTALGNLVESERTALRERFDFAMELSFRMFGEHSFRKSLAKLSANANRSPVNIALFEICAVTLSSDIAATADGASLENFSAGLRQLLDDTEFSRSITYSTNSTAPVHTRFTQMEALLVDAVLL